MKHYSKNIMLCLYSISSKVVVFCETFTLHYSPRRRRVSNKVDDLLVTDRDRSKTQNHLSEKHVGGGVKIYSTKTE